jgi:hypothetical protein
MVIRVKLEPVYVKGLYGISIWKGMSVEDVVRESMKRYPFFTPADGCRKTVHEFYENPPKVRRQIIRPQPRR